MLQSLADRPGGGSLDLVHLLPPFARARLYTYPSPEAAPALPKGDSRDCHWTALNFFCDPPDDRFANVAAVSATFARDYRVVSTPRFGDLVVLMSGGEVFHSAVYLADDVLFTKNGPRATRPWMLLPLAVMKDFYPQRSAIEVRYLRRHAADPPPPRAAGPGPVVTADVHLPPTSNGDRH